MRNLKILYIFILRAEFLTTFGSKVVILTVRNTKIYKIFKCNEGIHVAGSHQDKLLYASKIEANKILSKQKDLVSRPSLIL